MLRITSAIASAISAEDVYAALVDQVADATGASSVALWLVAEDARTAHLARARGYSDAARSSLAVLPIGDGPAIPVIECIRNAEPVWIRSQTELFARYPHLRSVATAGRPYRISALPLVSRERVLGAMGITLESPGDADADEQELLRLVARYAGQAVERLRLLDAERRSRAAADAAARRLHILSRASRGFAEAGLGLQERLNAIAAEVSDALGGCANVGLLDDDGRLWLGAVHHPHPEAQALLAPLASSTRLPADEGVTGVIAQTGKPVLLPALDSHEKGRDAGPYRSLLERFPVYAIVGAPLIVRERIIGTITAARVLPGATYDERDLDLLVELGERAAVALDNAQLYAATVEARSRAEQLYRFADAVAGADSIAPVFEAALTSIETAVGASRSAVLTYGADTTMRFRAWHSLSDAYRAAVDGHSPWRADETDAKPVLVPDAHHDESLRAYRALFESEGICALGFIPLVNNGKLLGKFMVYYDQPHQFTTQEIEIATAIASHLASVLSRFEAIARLEETVKQNELFAGVLAHDLRNPLDAIMTAAQLVLLEREGAGNGSDAASRPAGRILSSGQRMATMINQLLDFTRARSGGGIDIHPCDADLADLCANGIAELELSHPDWTIELSCDGDTSGTWDADRLLQVLSNLIANAGQHGRRSHPIRVRADGTASSELLLEVHNDGAMDTALIPSLFDPFRRTRQRHYGARGLGLGLYIVSEIVRAHGGSVQVTSTAETGTTVSVRLPRHTVRRAISESSGQLAH